MGRGETSSSASEKSSQGGEDGHQSEEISEYEKQRLSRIRENRKRLEALGLPHLASSLLAPLSKQQPNHPKKQGNSNKKRKGKGVRSSIRADEEEDEDYQPSEEDLQEDQEEDLQEDQEENDDDDEEEDSKASFSSRKKGKKKSSSNVAVVKNSSNLKEDLKISDNIDDDEALQLAIALSLGGLTHNLAACSDPNTPSASACLRKDRVNVQQSGTRKNSRKMSKSRVQLTEDEVVAYFFSFDEAGKGHITLRDLKRMVTAHDFNWADMEMASMIHSFDSDRDGRLSLEDFRTIVSRCSMLQES